MSEETKKMRVIIFLLVIIILILLVYILYTLVIKPKFNDYITSKQLEARDMVLTTILQQIQQQGFTQITFGPNNTLILVPTNYKKTA